MNSVTTKLAKARLEFGDILKDATAKGEKFSYNYATLDGMMKAIEPALGKHGLNIYHSFDYPEGRDVIFVCCRISDGESELSSTIMLPLAQVYRAPNPAQAMGSVLTYGRRYSLAAALCLTAEEDTDAVLPSSQRQSFKSPNQPRSEVVPKTSETIQPVAERKFDGSPRAMEWLTGVMDRYKIATDSRPMIIENAPGKTAPELEDIIKRTAQGEG